MQNSTPKLFERVCLSLLFSFTIVLFSCSKELEPITDSAPTTLEAKLEQNSQYAELRDYWSSAYEKKFNDSLLKNDAKISLRDQFLTYMEFRFSKLNSFLRDNAEYAEKRMELQALLSETPTQQLTKGWDGNMGEVTVDGSILSLFNDFTSKIEASRNGFYTSCPEDSNLEATGQFIEYMYRYAGYNEMSTLVFITDSFSHRISWDLFREYCNKLPSSRQLQGMHKEFDLFLTGNYARETHRRIGLSCCSGSGGSGGGSGSGGSVPSTNPDNKPCNDAKCPTCGKCLKPSKSSCVKCVCVHVHNHEICDLCNRCYKDNSDICKLTTKSSAHSSACETCDCWNEINQDSYATREAQARAELHYINARGGSSGKNFVRDMEDLLSELRKAKTKMNDVYPLYDLIHKKFMELRGVYMLMISDSFLEYGSIIMDLAYLHSAIEDTFIVYRNFIKRKMNVEISRSAWTGA
ncbi:MAG: hypothetical protein RR550_01290, partial [Rikenellaceae bacterium]